MPSSASSASSTFSTLPANDLLGQQRVARAAAELVHGVLVEDLEHLGEGTYATSSSDVKPSAGCRIVDVSLSMKRGLPVSIACFSCGQPVR
jgi:hypothetical protein